MSSPARPMGPRSQRNQKEGVPTLSLLPIAPLNVTKRPGLKLQLPSLNATPAPKPGSEDDYGRYYGVPTTGSSSTDIPSLTTAKEEDKATLRPPMGLGDNPNNLNMTDLAKVISSYDQSWSSRTPSRGAREQSGSREGHSRDTTTISPKYLSEGRYTEMNGSTPTPLEIPVAGTGEEKWSDDILKILDRLGEGAGGAVYKVQDTRTGLLYARKTIPTRTTPAKQLLSELKHLSGSQHENICDFHGAYMSPSTSEVNVLMELCEGGSLEAIAKRVKEIGGTTHEQLIGKLADGILKGLNFLHSLRIIHRDVKPSNILLTLTGIVKLCDFGVSGELEDSMVTTFTGTSWYMAPERVNGQPYTVRADVWSTGLSLLELALNRYPLPEDLDGIIDLMSYITRGPPIELVDTDDQQWSDGAKYFIRQCLRVRYEDRPYPRDLLSDPWVMECTQSISDRKVAHWVREIWGLKKSRALSSRPVSRQDAGIDAGQSTSTTTSHSSQGDRPPWAESPSAH